MRTRSALTKRQAAILAFIRARIAVGLPPTFREIGQEFGITSPNGVTCHLRALERKGRIIRDQRLSRAIFMAE